MTSKGRKKARTSLALLAVAACCVFLAGCEEDDRGPQIYVGNYSAGHVTVVIDAVSVGDLGPQEERPFDVAEGRHTVQLFRDDGSLIFEDSVELSSDQAAYYKVRSDESVAEPLLWNTDISVDPSPDLFL